MLAERQLLLEGIQLLGLTVSEDQLAQLLAFLALIQKWNKAYNLSGVRDSLEMVKLHLLDSIAVLPHLSPGRIIDIGTGAGLPGIPLAIMMPGSGFVLLDSNAKKTRFVQQVIVELKLKNASVVQARVEAYQPDQRFDAVITRAFACLPDIQKLTQHLLKPCGELVAMKGQPTPEELQAVIEEYTLVTLQVPGVDAARCLIKIKIDE